MNSEEFIQHYGKKGMKWGVKNSKFGRGVKKGKDKFLDDLDLPGRPNRRSNRLTPEQLLKENSGKAKAGKILAASILAAIGTIQIRNVIKSV